MWKCISVAMVLLAVAQTGGGETAETKAARAAITDVLNKQVEDWNKGDLLGFMAGYQKSNDLTFFSGGTVLRGWDATLERYQKKYQGEGKEMGKVSFRDVDVQVMSADSALVRGRWELKMMKETPGGLFTLIFRKNAEGWRIVHDHTSSN